MESSRYSNWPFSTASEITMNAWSTSAGLARETFVTASTVSSAIRAPVHQASWPNRPMKLRPSSDITKTKSPFSSGASQVPVRLRPSTRPSIVPS